MQIRFSTNRRRHPNPKTTAQDLRKQLCLTQRGGRCPMTTIQMMSQTTPQTKNHPTTMNPTGHL